MKFVEAVRAMKPGQLLVSPNEKRYEEINGRLHDFDTGKHMLMIDLPAVDYWSIIDKHRPKVDFATAMRAALEGKVIVSYYFEKKYTIKNGLLVGAAKGLPSGIDANEVENPWEILDEATV